jgi:Leucine-rich repeat (LRR) protein
MEYKINCICRNSVFGSKETFLNSFNNVKDSESNKLEICIGFNDDINFMLEKISNFKKIKLSLILFTNISKIPKIIFNLINIRELYIFDNNIEYIQFNILKLQKLEKIWIQNNKCNKLYLCDLQNLRYISSSELNDDLIYLKKRLLFRLYFLIHKSSIIKNLKYKINKILIFLL